MIEMIVVIMLLAIIAVIIIPQAIDTGGLQATSAARKVATDLEYAQNIAITTQTPITVKFYPTSEYYKLFDANTSEVLKHPMTKADYIVDFTKEKGFGQLNIVSARFGVTNEVTFDELGAPSDAGSVVVQAGSLVYQIDVAAATGKVAVTETGS